MSDNTNSIIGAPAEGERTEKSTQRSPVVPMVPMDVRLRVADLANVPIDECELFCDYIQMPVNLIWEAHVTDVGPALAQTAAAARALQEAFDNLNINDRERVEDLWDKMPYKYLISGLSNAVHGLSDLFSIAAGQARLRSTAPRGHRRGRRSGTVSNLAFREFVHWLLVIVTECGGTLRFDKNYPDKGNLVKALKVFRPYLPAGVLPIPLPLGTIQRIIDNPGQYVGYPAIQFFRAK
jgi:hypothetical protein